MCVIMAEDIDDLLNCIEKKMNTRLKTWDSDDDDDVKSYQTLPNKTTSDRCHGKHDAFDVSDILGDDDDDDDVSPNIYTSDTRQNTKISADATATSLSASLNVSNGTKKCFPLYIGGSACTKGLSTTANNRTCDRLRCTDCDFSVSSFDDVQWASNTDYLFLRNNMPDYKRLKSKLKTKKGCRAYACQCRWYSASDFTELSQTDVKWVCGKHS